MKSIVGVASIPSCVIPMSAFWRSVPFRSVRDGFHLDFYYYCLCIIIIIIIIWLDTFDEYD